MSATFRQVQSVELGLANLRIGTVPRREPGPGECLVRVERATVNRSDLHRVEGSYGGMAMTRFAGYGGAASGASGIYVPGMEAAGTVLEIGDRVDPQLVNRRVLVHSHRSCGTCKRCAAGLDNECEQAVVFGSQTPGTGGWSEQVIVPADQVLTLDDSVSLDAVVGVEVTYGPVWWGLHDIAGLGPGDTLLVQGGDSTLGLAAVNVANHLGARTVPVVRDPNSARARDLLELTGVEPVSREELPRWIATNLHEPPRVCLDLVGAATFATGFDLLARGGALIVVGAHAGVETTLRLDRLFQRNLMVRGISRAPLSVMVHLVGLVTNGHLAPKVTMPYALNEIDVAVQAVHGPAELARVLLDPQK